MADVTTLSPSDRDSEEHTGTPVAGLDRAAAIFDAFDESHRELTLAALVRRSGLPRSTLHRTADRMIKLGWLDTPGSRGAAGLPIARRAISRSTASRLRSSTRRGRSSPPCR